MTYQLWPLMFITVNKWVELSVDIRSVATLVGILDSIVVDCSFLYPIWL